MTSGIYEILNTAKQRANISAGLRRAWANRAGKATA